MVLRRFLCLVLLAAAWSAPVFAAKQKPCVTIDEATKLVNKDVCVSAHVYNVVKLQDGTRFLDVCSPQTPDADCRFTIVSLSEDREDVGELSKYRDRNVQIRGIVRPMRGRAGMMLNRARQFHGGPPKFEPNPMLASGFNAAQSQPPIYDPNLRAQGGKRSFMNSREQEARPAK